MCFVYGHPTDCTAYACQVTASHTHVSEPFGWIKALVTEQSVIGYAGTQTAHAEVDDHHDHHMIPSGPEPHAEQRYVCYQLQHEQCHTVFVVLHVLLTGLQIECCAYSELIT